MPTPLPKVLINRLSMLQALGVEVDNQAARWLADQTGAQDEAALTSITEARRVIELTVDLAVAEGCVEHPALLAMRTEWEQRFAAIKTGMTEKQNGLSKSLRQHQKQTRAARAYVRTEGLGH